MEIRKLGPEDAGASRELGVEAFGPWPSGSTPPPLPTETPPGRHAWGAFDEGRLVAKVQAHEYESWWHGERVPTAGIAGVAVAAEHRGGGLLRTLFEAMLAEALARGEVISTLYPTANGIYRSLGYELITSYDTVEVPTAELGRVPAPTTCTTRRARVEDLPAVRQAYDAWASAQNGPLTRTGPLFAATDEEILAAVQVTLAVDMYDGVLGYMAWERTEGYGPQGRLRVHDLIGRSADAHRALWRVAASFASVTGTVRLSTSGDDPARLVLPSMTWDVVGRHPYMLRVLDVAGALSALPLSLPGGASASLDIGVVGDRLGVLDGQYRLEVGDGPARCIRVEGGLEGWNYGGPDFPILTPQGLTLLLAGAQSTGNLRMLGHLTGVSHSDRLLDALFGARQVHVRDYF